MHKKQFIPDSAYQAAMGRLLMLYTQVDSLIMRACAERIAGAPDENARLGLARQVGDESRHVEIQNRWMQQFGTERRPVIGPAQEAALLDHFRRLDWQDFLVDMYLCVEALGSDAVEQVVPLADPGTRESLKVPLADELNHIAFGMEQLRLSLDAMAPDERDDFVARIPGRIASLTRAFHDMCDDIPAMFENVGVDYPALCDAVLSRRDEVLQAVA